MSLMLRNGAGAGDMYMEFISVRIRFNDVETNEIT